MGKRRFLKTRNFSGLQLRNEEVILSDDAIWILGQHTLFDNCKIVCRVGSSQLIVKSCQITAGQFIAEKRLENIGWSSAVLMCTRFIGHFSGCDFGRRIDVGDSEAGGCVERCDFAQAILDGCRFFNTDVRSLKLPPWPCFTIVDYGAAARDFENSNLSKSVRRYAATLASIVQKGETGACLYAPEEARSIGCSEDQLEVFLRGKSYIVSVFP